METPKELKSDMLKFNKILAEASTLRRKKLRDYGLSYCNSGQIGVVIRIADKMARLHRIYIGKIKPSYETARDTAIDIINYSAMLVMLIDKEREK